jgi:hypothetical protein
MRIIPFVYNDEFSPDPDNISKSNIISCKRLIYLLNENNFVESDINSNCPRTMILINYSKTKYDNYTSINKSTYILDAYCNNITFRSNFKELKFNLKYALVSGFRNDIYNYNKNIYYDLSSGLSDNFSTHTGARSIYFDDLYDDNLNMVQDQVDILDPRYYNRKHYELDTNCEYKELAALNYSSYYGVDLIDQYTELYEVKPKSNIHIPSIQLYEKDKNGLIPTNKSVWETFEQTAYINNFSTNIFRVNHESLLNDYIFIYDTELNQFCYKQVNLYNQYNQKERIIDKMTLLKDLIMNYALRIKDKFGDIRVMYYYSNISEVVTIDFAEGDLKKLTSTYKPQDLFERADVSTFWYKYEEELNNRFGHNLNYDLIKY